MVVVKVITSGKRILIVSLTVVLIAAASVYGMQVLTFVNQVTPVISVATWDQFELKLEANKATFGVGEPVEIKVSLTNIGNETAELAFTHKNQKVMFRIFDTNGTDVFGTNFVGLMATQTVSLEPNQTLSETYAWMQKGMFDIYNSTTQVPIGNYTIIGKTGRFYFKDYTSPSVWIETQPIVITIE